MTVQRVKLADLTSPYIQQLKEQYAGKDVDVEIIISEAGNAVPESPMNEDRFWEVISLLDWSKEGNDDVVIEPAVQYLVRLPESAIHSFYDLLSEKLHLLDGRVFAEGSASDDGYISSDLFLYGRCCVVANGREYFERVLNNPAEFPKDLYFEAILDIPERAWFRKTGTSLDYFPKYNYETGFNPNGWGADTITL